jgi:hypothetical protein
VVISQSLFLLIYKTYNLFTHNSNSQPRQMWKFFYVSGCAGGLVEQSHQHTLKRCKTFTSWRGCLPDNISLYSFTYIMSSLNPRPLWYIYEYMKNTTFIYAPFKVGTMNTCNMIELNLERLSTAAVKFYVLRLKYRRVTACWKRKHAAVLYVKYISYDGQKQYFVSLI